MAKCTAQEAEMASRWIVVANSGAADIYSADSANARPELWRHLEHAGSRSKGSDLVSDRPGRSFDSAGQGRHAMETRHTPKEVESENFARELGELLEHGRVKSLYEELILVAPPDFLGQLRKASSDGVHAVVVAELAKNLAGEDIETICQGLRRAS
jgi:protein required for attachment to host cells